MNLYRVISETLWETVPILDDGTGPEEPYAICCLVAAQSRNQARWSAWRTDKTFESDPREMPKFSVRLKAKGVDLPAGVVDDGVCLESDWGWAWFDDYSPAAWALARYAYGDDLADWDETSRSFRLMVGLEAVA